MPEYIDVAELKRQISDFKRKIQSPNSDYLTGYVCALSITEGMIAGLPTADVVEVVRCKDCKMATEDILLEGFYLCEKDLMLYGADHFCNYGERKEE